MTPPRSVRSSTRSGGAPVEQSGRAARVQSCTGVARRDRYRKCMDINPVVAASPATPRLGLRVLESLEDVFLVLLIILAVPAVMLLLAAPFAVLLRLAEMLGLL